MEVGKILERFKLTGKLVAVAPFGNGHINDTYLVEIQNGRKKEKYILQRMNETVFPNIDNLMENIVSVTSFLRGKMDALCKDSTRECLRIIKTVGDNNYLKYDDNTKWRLMTHIENTISYDIPKSLEMFEKAGGKFGEFIRLVDGFPIDDLHIIIPDFHNTSKRFETFTKAVKENRVNRLNSCIPEVEFANAREFKCGKIIDRMSKGLIPTRVAHNDTKLNNLLIDKDTNEPICVIDLDTIMPGSLLFDYGDAIRSGCNSADEDEKNLNKVHFDFDMFKSFTRGFIKGLGETLTNKEKDYLSFSARLITYECGIRFLTDYLNGDKYFKTDYSEHNLVRCRTQFKLVKEMEEVKHEMKDFINSIK